MAKISPVAGSVDQRRAVCDMVIGWEFVNLACTMLECSPEFSGIKAGDNF